MPASRPAPGRAFVPFRVGGIEIAIHPSWLFTFIALVLVARTQLAPSFAKGGGAPAILLAVGVALLFYAFILLHELAHAFVARGYGLDARRVTLFVFGGVAQIGREAARPADEFRIALAGPLASLLIAGSLAAVARALHPEETGVGGVWGDLAVVNLLLALFNLVPAFPLDGGRILRAGIWAAFRDRAKATRWASAGGKAFAFAMMGAGAAFVALSVTTGDPPGAWPGLWYVVLGYFLFTVAGHAGRVEGGTGRVEEDAPGQAPLTELRARRRAAGGTAR